MDKLVVSVIIPVLNDPHGLKLCLQALENQTYPKDKIEVIVVDNNSETDIIKKVVEDFMDIELVYEEYPTSYAARNKGITVVGGDILAFTDADCIPAEDWIEQGVNALKNNINCGLVAGRIDVFYKSLEHQTAAEIFEKFTAFNQRDCIARWRFGATANVFTRKDVIGRVGFFNSKLRSGGDLEWGQRVFQAGYQQLYAPNVAVKHPACDSILKLYKKHCRVIGGLHDLKISRGYPLKEFLRDLKDDWPQFSDFKSLYHGLQKISGIMKIKVLVIMILVKMIRIAERIRLYIFVEAKSKI